MYTFSKEIKTQRGQTRQEHSTAARCRGNQERSQTRQRHKESMPQVRTQLSDMNLCSYAHEWIISATLLLLNMSNHAGPLESINMLLPQRSEMSQPSKRQPTGLLEGLTWESGEIGQSPVPGLQEAHDQGAKGSKAV